MLKAFESFHFKKVFFETKNVTKLSKSKNDQKSFQVSFDDCLSSKGIKLTNLNLSAVADFEYYERELSNVLINNRLGQNIFHMIHNDKDALLVKVIKLGFRNVSKEFSLTRMNS